MEKANHSNDSSRTLKRKATTDLNKKSVPNPKKYRRSIKKSKTKNQERQFCRDYHYRGFCSFGPHCRYSHSTMNFDTEFDWYAVFAQEKSDLGESEDVYLSYFFLRTEMIPASDHRLEIFQTFCSKKIEEDCC